MKCKNCNKGIDEDSKFCPSCGEMIEKTREKSVIDVDKEVIDHLEYLGYEVNKIELNSGNIQRYSAIHKSKPNLIFNSIENLGLSFVTFYNINEGKVKKNHKEALELINRMNNQALFCSFSIPPSLDSFVCATMYLGKYSKKQFADFLDIYEADIQNRLKAEDYLQELT